MRKNIVLFVSLLVVLFSFACCSEDKGTNPIIKTDDYDLISVPATSGYPMGWVGESDDEEPVHSVFLDAFQIGKYEVTYELWSEVKTWAEANGYIFWFEGQKGADPSTSTDQHPVTTISWRDCIAWCNAYSEYKDLDPAYYKTSAKSEYYKNAKTGDISNDCVDWSADGFRLPTEAEWEYAARYIDASNISSGAEHSGYNLYPDINDCANSPCGPVGQLKANSLGAYDMSGNVMEWCWDWYGEDYYATSPTDNPLGPDSGANRVIRGGAWWEQLEYCRTARRDSGNFYAANYCGFRICRGVAAD